MRGAHHAALTLTTTLVVLLIARTAGAQLAAWNSYGYVNLNSVFQPSSSMFPVTSVEGRSFALFGERGEVDIARRVDRDNRFIDISGGVRVYRNLAFGVGYSRLGGSSEAVVSARLPHPLFFDAPRVTDVIIPFERRERAVHLQGIFVVPLHPRLELAVFGGPSFYTLQQGFVVSTFNDLVFREVGFPFTDVDITGIQTSEIEENSVGFNVGADVSYMVTPWLGAGMFLRYAGTSVDVPAQLPQEAGDLGGFQVGVGLRTRFPQRRTAPQRPAVLAPPAVARPAGAAAAEQETTLRVVRTAVIVNEPRGDADVVATVSSGEVLELLDQRGSWYLVRPPEGTTAEWRTGWINQAQVEPLDGSVVPRIPAAPTPPRPLGQPSRSVGAYPGSETSVGWSLLNDFTLNQTSALGFYVAGATNFNPWAGVAVEGGGNFLSLDAFGVDVLDADIYTVMAGPKFTLRTVDRLAPFGQLLFGVAYSRADVLGFRTDDWSFAMQPGGGVDVILTDAVALRVGTDWRVLFDAGETFTEFRFSTGVTFRSNFK